MLLSVVVDMELVHSDGWRSCRTVGLCEVEWLVLNLTGCVKSGGRVEHGGLCEVDGLTWLNMPTCVKLSMLSNLASCRVVVLCQ